MTTDNHGILGDIKRTNDAKKGVRRSLFYSVSFRFVSFIVLVALLTGGIIAYVTLRTSREALRQDILGNNLAQADLAAEFTANYINVIEANARSFSVRPSILDVMTTHRFEEAHAQLAQFIQIQTVLDTCGLYDVNGIQVANSDPNATTIGQPFADREWFQQAAVTRQPYQSIPVKSRVTGNAITPYAVPILNDQGKLLGFFTAGISLAKLSDAIVNINYGKGTRSSIIDFRNGGLIIAHIDPLRVLTAASGKNAAVTRLLKGERGSIEATSSTGEQDLVGFSPVPGIPWGVLVITPSETALMPIDTLTRTTGLYAFIIILFASMVGGMFMLQVTRPIRQLVEGTKEIGGGNLDYQAANPAKDEIGDLSRAFSDMAGNLKTLLVSRESLMEEISGREWTEEELRKTQNFLENLIHYANAPILVWDADDRIVRFNQAFENLTGRPSSEMVGQEMEKLFPLETREQTMKYIHQASRGERWETVEIPIRNIDGRERILLWNFATIFDNEGKKVEATIVQGQDITERRLAEKNLKGLNETLEQKVKERTAELDASYQELESFSYSVSHDLRAPLRHVHGFIELLVNSLQGTPDIKVQHYLHVISNATNEMGQLIDGLLSFSRIGKAEMKHARVELATVIRNVIESFGPDMNNRKITWNISDLPDAEGDRDMLQLVFANLISNALKYSRMNPSTVIEIGSQPDTEKMNHVILQDLCSSRKCITV